MSEREELVTVELCEWFGIVVGGELDILTAPLVIDVAPDISATHGQPIDVNLSNVTFIDASKVRALLKCGTAVRVVAASAPVEKVLKITDTYGELVAVDSETTP